MKINMRRCIIYICVAAVLLSVTFSFTINERILNGGNASPTPYAVAITSNGTLGTTFGGGVLISDRHVLTIGRLVARFSNWTVGYGTADLRTLINITTSTAVLHAGYNSSQSSNFYINDIAIIFLPVNSLNTNLASPLPLPSTVALVPQPNEEGHIVGFGAISSITSQPSPLLREAFIRSIESSRCAAQFNRYTDESFCATDQLYNQTLCYGDHGSGFVTRYFGQQVLVGLVTVIDARCDINGYSGYVRTQFHLDWIRAVAGLG